MSIPKPLADFLNETKNVLEYKRAMAIKLLILEFEPRDIAEVLDVTQSFVSKWKNIYYEGGVDALRVKYNGYQGYLTKEQHEAIIAWVIKQERWNTDLLEEHIRETYQVEFKSKQSYYDILEAAKITHKKAQTVPPEKNPQRIEAKKKEIEQILTTYWERIRTGKMVVYFIDESHLNGDDAVGYGWAPSDQRLKITMKQQNGRQTYFGALNMLTGDFVLGPYEKANGDTTVAFLNRLRKMHPDKQILILWDNVSYHHEGEMPEFLADVNMFVEPDNWNIICVRFEPHASEQNPIEHVWHIAKQRIRKYFHDIHSFLDIKEIFEQIKNEVFHFADLHMYLPNIGLL